MSSVAPSTGDIDYALITREMHSVGHVVGLTLNPHKEVVLSVKWVGQTDLVAVHPSLIIPITQ
jgi:hypothetical protein